MHWNRQSSTDLIDIFFLFRCDGRIVCSKPRFGSLQRKIQEYPSNLAGKNCNVNCEQWSKNVKIYFSGEVEHSDYRLLFC